MELFAARARRNLVRALQKDVRLMLAADPGPDRMLEYVRLYNPDARPGKHGQIRADSLSEVYLSGGTVIEPDVAAEAGVPAGTGVAFFVNDAEHAQPFSLSDARRVAKETYGIAVRLVNGLAIRTGGIAWPATAALGKPLEARVYTWRDGVAADDARGVIARYVPGLAPDRNVTLASLDVTAWQTGDGQFRAEFYPLGHVPLLDPPAYQAIGDMFYHRERLTAVSLQLSVAANQADPGTARLLGQCALELAAATGGLCTDQLGFRVLQPEELVFAGRA
jgi:hypothetical protein